MLVLRKESPDITKYRYKEEYKNLLMSIEALPGINIISSNLNNNFDKIKSSWNSILIFIHVDESEQEGLFFLTRCMDRRYWPHGYLWDIKLQVGDSNYSNGDRPITYYIERKIQNDSEETILGESQALINNLNIHYNHEAFMSGFKMNKSKYNMVDEKAFNRRIKLENIGI